MKPAAVDTNVLVRLATGDNLREHQAAARSLAHRPWRVLLTVVLETEWVLRSRYGYAPPQFAAFVQWLDAHPHVDLAQAATVRKALASHLAGMDFADALHLAQAGGDPLLTLDKALQRKADSLGLRVEALV